MGSLSVTQRNQTQDDLWWVRFLNARENLGLPLVLKIQWRGNYAVVFFDGMFAGQTAGQ